MSSVICIEPTGGLCNRLRTIFSWKEYYKSKQLNILWNKDEFCPGYFNDYFLDPQGCNFIYDKTIDNISYRGYQKHKDIKHTKKIYSDLILKNNILSEIECYKTKFYPYNAVHVRRTDHKKLAIKHDRFTTDDIFYKFIENSKYNVLIASDNQKTIVDYKKKYNDKVFSINKFFNKTNLRQTSLKDSIIDLFLCINAIEFLGSGWSSFTDFIKIMRN